MALFSRTPAKAVRTGTPQQQQFQDTALSQAMQILNGNGGLNPIGRQAVNRFSTETVPMLAERFASLGSGGSQRSSAFQGALGSAAAGLNQDLAAQQYDIMGLLSQIGHQGTLYQPEEPGFFENIFSKLLEVAPQVASSLLSSYLGVPSAPKSTSAPYGYRLGGNPLGSTNLFSQGAPQNSSLNQILSGGH